MPVVLHWVCIRKAWDLIVWRTGLYLVVELMVTIYLKHFRPLFYLYNIKSDSHIDVAIRTNCVWGCVGVVLKSLANQFIC